MDELLRECDYDYILEAYQNGRGMYTREGIGPDPYTVIANDRATCRICGKKIAKGEKAITFCWSNEGNPWTARDIYIHADGCPK